MNNFIEQLCQYKEHQDAAAPQSNCHCDSCKYNSVNILVLSTLCSLKFCGKAENGDAWHYAISIDSILKKI